MARSIRFKPFSLIPVLLVLFLAGCATPQTDALLKEGGDGLPQAFEIQDVPFYPQKAYECGPATLAMALSWVGDPVDPEDLVGQVYSPARKGSLPPEMISAARRRGYLAYPVTDMLDLFAEVASGHPVIVLENLGLSWYPVWHYALVIGYDLPQEAVTLHSGDDPHEVLPLRLFERMWARSHYWGLVVLPPGRLPIHAKERRYLEAALGLERADQPRAAHSAYRAGRKLWPDSLELLIGMGNTSYALGDLAGAAEAFRIAATTHPDSGPALNNLAHVLARQGHRDEALYYAKRAVAMGGPDRAIFLKTLHEIDGPESGG